MLLIAAPHSLLSRSYISRHLDVFSTMYPKLGMVIAADFMLSSLASLKLLKAQNPSNIASITRFIFTDNKVLSGCLL